MLVFLFLGPMMFGIEYSFYSDREFYELEKNEFTGETDFVVTNRTLHYTFLFNTFVAMTLLNQINATKVGLKDYNVFSGIHNNLYFMLVFVAEVAVQFVLVCMGSIIVRTTPPTMQMNIATLVAALGVLLVAHVAKWMSKDFLEKKFSFEFLERDTPQETPNVKNTKKE